MADFLTDLVETDGIRKIVRFLEKLYKNEENKWCCQMSAKGEVHEVVFGLGSR